MESCAILSLVPAPLVAVALYALLRYKYPKGKFGLLHKTFLLGMAGILPVFAIDKLIAILHLDSLHSLNRTLFYAFALTAAVFELWKFLILRMFVYPSKLVAKSIDVIIYSVIIAAGFTTGYSIYALYFAPSFIDLCQYALTVGPAFVLISVIMGYFTGIALKRDYPVVDMMTGLFLAIVFQGIYRFCILTSDSILLYLSMIGILIIGITLMRISIRENPDSN